MAVNRILEAFFGFPNIPARVIKTPCSFHDQYIAIGLGYLNQGFQMSLTTQVSRASFQIHTHHGHPHTHKPGRPNCTSNADDGAQNFSMHMGYNVEAESDLDLIRKKYDCDQNVTDRV